MVREQERIGEKVGQYRLKRYLGRGSFGTVYLAENLHEQTQVAIKLLHTPLTTNDNWQSFLNEARSIRLQHPHIIPLLDFGLSHEEVPFLVTEYAPGGTLREHYKRARHFSLATVSIYTQQIASALQYAHNRHLIHRDVKPENMLLRADGTVLLSDFGLARILEQSSALTHPTHAGTPAYMAPEQAKGRPCPASDQYALAVVVYEWIAGRRPFLGAPMEVAIQHQLEPPPALHILCPHIPLAVAQILARALAKKPDERFESVEHFSQEFQQTIKNVGIGTTLVRRLPFTPAKPAQKQSFTKPALPVPLATNELEQSPNKQFAARPVFPPTLATGEVEKVTGRQSSLAPILPSTLASDGVEKITDRHSSLSPVLPPPLANDGVEKITKKFAVISGIDETTKRLSPDTQMSFPSRTNLPSVSSSALSSPVNSQPILSPALLSPTRLQQPIALVLPSPQPQTKKPPQSHYWRVGAILLFIGLLVGGGILYWSLQAQHAAHLGQIPSFTSLHTPSTSQSTASTSTSVSQTSTATPSKAQLTPAVGETTSTPTAGGVAPTPTVGGTTSTPTAGTSSSSLPPGVPGGWHEVINDPMTASQHSSSWEQDSTCTFTSQAYTMQSLGSNYCIYGSSTSPSSTFGDLYYSIDLSILQGNQAGITFRDIMNNYYYFSIKMQGSYSLSFHTDANGGQDRTIVAGNSTAIYQGLNQWNHLTVIARGSSIALFINNTSLGAPTDTTRNQGIIGVAVNGADSQTISASASFKNITIWTP